MGLNGLIYSNGFSSMTWTHSDQNQISTRVELRNSFMSENYNISFILFCLLPFVLGGSILVVLKIMEKMKSDQNKVHDEYSVRSSNDTGKNKYQLFRVMVERVFYEWTFWGLMFGGNLAWISLFYFMKEDKSSVLNLLYAVFFSLFYLVYSVVYLRTSPNFLEVKTHHKTDSKIPHSY